MSRKDECSPGMPRNPAPCEKIVPRKSRDLRALDHGVRPPTACGMVLCETFRTVARAGYGSDYHPL